MTSLAVTQRRNYPPPPSAQALLATGGGRYTQRSSCLLEVVFSNLPRGTKEGPPALAVVHGPRKEQKKKSDSKRGIQCEHFRLAGANLTDRKSSGDRPSHSALNDVSSRCRGSIGSSFRRRSPKRANKRCPIRHQHRATHKSITGWQHVRCGPTSSKWPTRALLASTEEKPFALEPIQNWLAHCVAFSLSLELKG